MEVNSQKLTIAVIKMRFEPEFCRFLNNKYNKLLSQITSEEIIEGLNEYEEF